MSHSQFLCLFYSFETLQKEGYSSRVLNPQEHFDNTTGPYPFGIDPVSLELLLHVYVCLKQYMLFSQVCVTEHLALYKNLLDLVRVKILKKHQT